MQYSLKERKKQLIKGGFERVSNSVLVSHEKRLFNIHKNNVKLTNSNDQQIITMTKKVFGVIKKHKDYKIHLFMECQDSIVDINTKVYVLEINGLEKVGVKNYIVNKETGRKIENSIKYKFNVVKKSKKPILGTLTKVRKSSKKSTEINSLPSEEDSKVS